MRTVSRREIVLLLLVFSLSCARWTEVRPGDGGFTIQLPNVETCSSSNGPKRWGSLKKWECKGKQFNVFSKQFALYSAYLYQLPAGHGPGHAKVERPEKIGERLNAFRRIHAYGLAAHFRRRVDFTGPLDRKLEFAMPIALLDTSKSCNLGSQVDRCTDRGSACG